MAKPKGITETELKSIVDQEAYSALGYIGKLTEQRRRSLEYYLARANGDLAPPEVEGRSSSVSPDVATAIEGAMPSLMRIFASGEKTVTFEPRKPGDEPKADMATDYVNYLYWTKNHGFKLTYCWIKDSLLQKNGILKVYAEKKTDTKTEEYEGLTEAQMVALVSDDDVEVLEQSAQPDMDAPPPIPGPNGATPPPAMVYDLKIRRTCDDTQIKVANVPPEEFLISRQARSMDDDTFKAHRVSRTLGELVAMGFDRDKVLKLSDDTNWSQNNSESIERRVYDDEYSTQNTPQTDLDPMMRRLWLIEAYVKCDYDGAGITTWRKVVKAGSEILENEECDGPPFVDMTPIIMPHRFFGLSMADVTMEWQKVKTALVRQLLDALYLGNNPRYEANPDQVNMDDLLTARPGGVVRSKQIGSVQPLQTSDVSAPALAGIQYIDSIIDERTGVSASNAGLDPAMLSKTPVGTMDMAQQASMQKLELVARVFAECGFANLFRMMLKFITRYQDKTAMMRVEGQWVEVDPREWEDGFDMSVSVGQNTGNRTVQAGQLQQLIALQQAMVPMGIATPQNLYHSAKKLPHVLGYKDADQFFSDPAKMPPQPPQPHPEQIKAQAQMQIEQMKEQGRQQSDAARMQQERELEQWRSQLQAQVDTHRQQVEADQKELERQAMMQLEQFKAQLQAQSDERKAMLAQDTAVKVAQINAWGRAAAAEAQSANTLTPEQTTAAGESQ